MLPLGSYPYASASRSARPAIGALHAEERPECGRSGSVSLLHAAPGVGVGPVDLPRRPVRGALPLHGAASGPGEVTPCRLKASPVSSSPSPTCSRRLSASPRPRGRSCASRRAAAYGPLVALALTSVVSLIANLGDDGDPMTVLEAVALAARAVGFAVSLYTVLAWRRRVRPSDPC